MAAKERYRSLAFRAAADISSTILVPVVAAALASTWLGLERTMSVTVLVVALVFTAVVLVKKIRFYGKAYRELVDSEHHGDGAARG